MSTIFSTVPATPPASQTGTPPVRVLVVDDHQLFRIGLRRLLEHEGFTVADGDTAESALRRCAGHTPDVVVIGVNRITGGGGDAVRLVREGAPAAAVVVLALVPDPGHVLQAVRAGAVGYLLKDTELDGIVAGIRDAASGHAPFSPSVARVLVDRLRQQSEPDAPLTARKLSPRERAVLSLVASGYDNSEIAGRLYLSRSTVKNHVASLLEKLQVDNRVQAATYAVRAGLI